HPHLVSRQCCSAFHRACRHPALHVGIRSRHWLPPLGLNHFSLGRRRRFGRCLVRFLGDCQARQKTGSDQQDGRTQQNRMQLCVNQFHERLLTESIPSQTAFSCQLSSLDGFWLG